MRMRRRRKRKVWGGDGEPVAPSKSLLGRGRKRVTGGRQEGRKEGQTEEQSEKTKEMRTSKNERGKITITRDKGKITFE